FGNPTTITLPGTGQVIRTYNDGFAPDGTRQLTGFRVVFDRPVVNSSFTAADIRVVYQDPATGGLSTIPVNNPIPIDPVWGAHSQFPRPGTYVDTDGTFYYFPTTVTPGGQEPTTSTNAFFIPFTTPQSSIGT